MTSSTCVSRSDDVTARPAPAWWITFVLAGLMAIAIALLGYLMHGKPLAEKTLTTLMMPVGFFWIVLSGRLLHLLIWGPRTGVVPMMVIWLVLMTLATRPIPRWIIRSIEASIETYQPERDGPLDLVVVLGGGTSQGYWRPQVSGAGDRLVMAAELYHQGLTKELITTGQSTAGVSNLALDPSEQTRIIWTKLNVSPDAIRAIGGRNTFEEIQQLKKIWPDLAGKRVGLLTSALHLPRAVRLAKAQGLEMTPIAADVRTAVDDWGMLNFIPSAGNFAELANAQHEIMAAWVSR